MFFGPEVLEEEVELVKLIIIKVLLEFGIKARFTYFLECFPVLVCKGFDVVFEKNNSKVGAHQFTDFSDAGYVSYVGSAGHWVEVKAKLVVEIRPRR